MAIFKETQLASNFNNLVRLYPQGWQSGAFRNEEGRAIHFAKASAYGDKKGTVVFTTGYGDSINFHYDAVRNFQERGYDVYAMDWIGQGLSDRENPDDVRDSNDRLMTRHMQDLHKFISHIVPKDHQPLYLATHSMGGHVGMMYLKNYPNTFDAAIMAAPMIDLNTSFLPRPIFKGLVNVANMVGLGDNALPNLRTLLSRATKTSDNLRELSANPDQLTLSQEASESIRALMRPVEVDLPSWGWIKNAYSSLDDMRDPAYFKNIKTPVLMFAAGQDELVSNKAIKRAADNLPDGKIVEVPTGLHGLWNSNAQNHNTLWNAIDGFIGSGKPVFTPQYAAPAQPERTMPRPVLVSSAPALACCYG